MNIDRELVRKEATEQAEFFTRFGDTLPMEMELERQLQLTRIFRSPEVWDLAILARQPR